MADIFYLPFLMLKNVKLYRRCVSAIFVLCKVTNYAPKISKFFNYNQTFPPLVDSCLWWKYNMGNI